MMNWSGQQDLNLRQVLDAACWRSDHPSPRGQTGPQSKRHRLTIRKGRVITGCISLSYSRSKKWSFDPKANSSTQRKGSPCPRACGSHQARATRTAWHRHGRALKRPRVQRFGSVDGSFCRTPAYPPTATLKADIARGPTFFGGEECDMVHIGACVIQVNYLSR
jgi:hypothetical protein